MKTKFIYKKVNNITPLMLAASRGQMDSVKLLINAGVEIEARDSNGETALDYAINKEKLEVADYLEQRSNRQSK